MNLDDMPRRCVTSSDLPVQSRWNSHTDASPSTTLLAEAAAFPNLRGSDSKIEAIIVRGFEEAEFLC